MHYSTQLVVFVLCSKCIGVNIKRLEVPVLVEDGVDFVVLDCDYDVGAPEGLVMKWFFNGSTGLVYQWIPPMRPQVIGLLKDKVDLNFRISDEPLQQYRAIKILKPNTHLSGNYTCLVSTFEHEDRRTKPMLVYSPGISFEFKQEKKYVFLVTLICVAEKLYPKPTMMILSKGNPLPQLVCKTEMDSWGLYTESCEAIVHDDEVTTPSEEFVCLMTLPQANYTVSRTTVYHPGLMPTSDSTSMEVVKPQERNTNDCGPLMERFTGLFAVFLILQINVLL